jgi:hypothetical protein
VHTWGAIVAAWGQLAQWVGARRETFVVAWAVKSARLPPPGGRNVEMRVAMPAFAHIGD